MCENKQIWGIQYVEQEADVSRVIVPPIFLGFVAPSGPITMLKGAISTF
jgi:hypothetical protein